MNAGVGGRVLPALAAAAQSLTAAGVPTSLNPATARPGGGWLKPLRVGPGTYTSDALTASLYLLAPDHGTDAVLTSLGELLDTALTVVGDQLDPAVPVDLAVALVTPDNPSGYPAALLTLTLDV